MCRSLSRILQIFHSFSSRAVGAVFVATSLRHFAPVPPGVVSAASAELPPGFLPGVVGSRRTLSFSARLRQVSEGPWGNRGRLGGDLVPEATRKQHICTSTCCESCLFWMRRGKCRQFCIWLDLRPHWLPRRRWHRDCLVSVVVAGAVLHHHAADGVVRCSNASLKRCLQHTLVFRVELAPLRRVVSN